MQPAVAVDRVATGRTDEQRFRTHHARRAKERRVPRTEQLRTRIHRAPVQLFAAGAPAHLRAALEHGDVHSRRRELARGHQPGRTCSDYRNSSHVVFSINRDRG